MRGLAALEPKRLVVLGSLALITFMTIGLSSYFLSKPTQETLYSGLDAEDVTRIGAALNAAGISYDISPDGKSVTVPLGRTARARMLLAEKGLPRSDNAGYELFDKMGSLGLTSFMQEVTRVRALEGEIARTIQTLQGVRAARVHLVMPDHGSFRSNRKLPSASVVIRADASATFKAASAIRHLVSGAIPGLTVDRVSVMSTDGTLMASGDDAVTAAPRNMVSLENQVAQQLRDNVSRTLIPFLGVGNFHASISARLNTDQRTTNEVVFDPETRVERSTKVVKQVDNSKNKRGNAETSVQQDIPLEESNTSVGENSSQSKERREETTNYEINSKKVATSSNGYRIDQLAVAVVVNKARLGQLLEAGGKNSNQDALIEEITQLVASAVGYDKKRGDTFKLTSVDFVDNGTTLEALPGPGFISKLADHTGSFVNGAAMIVTVVIFVWFGLKPALKQLLDADPQRAEAITDESDEEVPVDMTDDALLDGGFDFSGGGDEPLRLEDSNSSQEQLRTLFENDQDRAVMILKRWSQAEAA